jgi:glycogen(starch) synthase
MRILILSNFYPPARSGGYTQWCQEVSDGLARRGHSIAVLTSRHERDKASSGEHNIHRLLHLEGDLNYYRPLRFFTRWKTEHRENLAILERTLRDFDPDLIFVWGMWALSKDLAGRAERLLPGRVVYYLSDYWTVAQDWHTGYWQAPARRGAMRSVKRALGAAAMAILARERQPGPELQRVICVSARLRDRLVEAGLPIQHARVIYGGTDVGRFPERRNGDRPDGTIRLLYAGQIVHHKGVHTAIEAMAKLVNERNVRRMHLTLVGSGHPEYEAQLRDIVHKEHLQDHVSFEAPASRDQMPDLLHRFDALVFPSIYEEPLARMTQEAMAAGLVVVGTTTGGTEEILSEGETGLTFAPGDASGLADQVIRLVSDPDLRRRLSKAGRQTVLEKFTLDRMVSEIDDYLRACLADRSPDLRQNDFGRARGSTGGVG